MEISGLWTSMCFVYTALHALKEVYEVCGLIDAAGIQLLMRINMESREYAGRNHSDHYRITCLGMDA